MAFKYRTQGYPDYKEQAIFRLTQVIRSKLIRNEDFVLELNLGFPEHYDYVLSAKKFNSNNSLHLILFHTDDLGMCIERARFRYESGRHYVKPETIQAMYANTIPLLKTNFEEVDSVQFIDVSRDGPALVAAYERLENKLELLESKCKWFYDEVYPFLSSHEAS
jgi:predicted ABC-type ATPase